MTHCSFPYSFRYVYEHVDARLPEYDIDKNKKMSLKEYQERQYGDVEGTVLEPLSYIYLASLLSKQKIVLQKLLLLCV